MAQTSDYLRRTCTCTICVAFGRRLWPPLFKQEITGGVGAMMSVVSFD